MRTLLVFWIMWGLAYAQSTVSIESLAQRSYGGGNLETVRVLERNNAFTRYLVRYPSDGLTMYGFMNVPNTEGPFPVVLVLHGYVNPATYRTLTYTTRYADFLARANFIAIHPNYRGHGLSQGSAESGAWRIEYALEVLDLAAIVRSMSGKNGPLQKARPSIGLLGHSMGGGIAQRVAVLDPQIKGVVLYGSMHGDEIKNARQICHVFSGGTRGCAQINTPAAEAQAISPIYHYSRIQARVAVHHGTNDEQVPFVWMGEICQALQKAGVQRECYSYKGARHSFQGPYLQTFLGKIQSFFNQTLR